MYCNLSYYIVIAIVWLSTRVPRRGAARHVSGEPDRTLSNSALPLLPFQRAASNQYLINQAICAGLVRLEFSQRAFISTISKINISFVYYCEIDKQYETFIFISILSTFLWTVGEVSQYTLYMLISYFDDT